MSSEKNCRWDRSYDHFYTRLPSLPSAPASGCRHGYLKKETRSFTLPGLELNILFYGAGMVSSSSEHPSQTRFTCALILNFVTGHLGAAACRHPQNNTLRSHRNNSWAARQRSWSFCTERGRQSRWGLLGRLFLIAFFQLLIQKFCWQTTTVCLPMGRVLSGIRQTLQVHVFTRAASEKSSDWLQQNKKQNNLHL